MNDIRKNAMPAAMVIPMMNLVIYLYLRIGAGRRVTWDYLCAK